MYKGCLVATVSLLVLAIGIGQAQGAGYFATERGAVSVSRGGASVVSARGLEALWLNPANVGPLGDGERLLELDVGFIHQGVRFERFAEPSSEPGCCQSVKNQALPFVDPSLSASWTQGDWGFGFGVYGPYAAPPSYPEGGAQRYSLIEANMLLVNYQATAAWQALPSLRLGAGLQLRHFSLEQRMMVSTYPGFPGGPEDPEYDMLVSVNVDDNFSPGLNLGIVWEPVRYLQVGASWQSPMTVNGKGTLQSRIPAHYMFATTEMEGEKIRFQSKLPGVFRLGLRYLAQRYDLEMAVVHESWSRLDTIRVSPEEDIMFTGVAGVDVYRVRDFELYQGFKDTLSLRFGGSYQPIPGGLMVRGGAYVEQGAVPDEYLTVQLVDGNKLGLGLGASLPMERVVVDLALSRVFIASRNVTNSEVRQVNPLYPEEPLMRAEGRTLVGNGRYKASTNVVSVAIKAFF